MCLCFLLKMSYHAYTGTRKLEYAGSTWHEGCFICHSCEQPIGSKSFIPDKDEHYCVPCYEDKFAPRCTRCKKVRLLIYMYTGIQIDFFLKDPSSAVLQLMTLVRFKK